ILSEYSSGAIPCLAAPSSTECRFMCTISPPRLGSSQGDVVSQCGLISELCSVCPYCARGRLWAACSCVEPRCYLFPTSRLRCLRPLQPRQSLLLKTRDCLTNCASAPTISLNRCSSRPPPPPNICVAQSSVSFCSAKEMRFAPWPCTARRPNTLRPD